MYKFDYFQEDNMVKLYRKELNYIQINYFYFLEKLNIVWYFVCILIYINKHTLVKREKKFLITKLTN